MRSAKPRLSPRIAESALLAAALIGAAGAALWWRRNPSACPYSQRLWIELPRPFLTRAQLRELLAPEPGQRVLEAYSRHTAI